MHCPRYVNNKYIFARRDFGRRYPRRRLRHKQEEILRFPLIKHQAGFNPVADQTVVQDISSQAKEIVNFSPLVHRRATLQIFLPYYLVSVTAVAFALVQTHNRPCRRLLVYSNAMRRRFYRLQR
jgi:hypothetical protein